MSDNDKTRWLYGEIGVQTHTVFLRIASREGVHVSELLKMAIESFIKEYANQSEEDGIIAVEAAHTQALARERQIAQLKNLAYIYSQTNDELQLEKLTQLCQVCNVDIEYLLDEVQSSPITAQIIGNLQSNLDSVEIWLLETLEKHGEVQATEIMELAAQRGFTESIVKKAKVRLKDDNGRVIQSVRRPDHWVWKLSEEARH